VKAVTERLRRLEKESEAGKNSRQNFRLLVSRLDRN
jgi:hypothetical protein